MLSITDGIFDGITMQYDLIRFKMNAIFENFK